MPKNCSGGEKSKGQTSVAGGSECKNLVIALPIATLQQRREFSEVMQSVCDRVDDHCASQGFLRGTDGVEARVLADDNCKAMVAKMTQDEQAHLNAWHIAMPLGHIDHATQANSFSVGFGEQSIFYRPQLPTERMTEIFAGLPAISYAGGAGGAGGAWSSGEVRVPSKRDKEHFKRLCRSGQKGELCGKCWVVGHKTLYCRAVHAVEFPFEELTIKLNEEQAGACSSKRRRTLDITKMAVGEPVEVLWDGEWWEANILQNTGVKVLVHYANSNSDEDEWIACSAARFQLPQKP